MDILLIYQFCTFGGVERVILNRAQAYRKYGVDVKISIGYLADRGALQSFSTYIQRHNLQAQVMPFLFPQDLAHDWAKYDYVFIIDTPQVFEASASAKNVHVECHSLYTQSRQYLHNLPKHIKSVIVPSNSLKQLLQTEHEGLPEIYILPNPVSDEYFDIQPLEKNIFTRRPITYFARVEDLKNFIEAARIFETLTEHDDLMYWVIGEYASDKQTIQSLERKRLLHKSFLRDRIAFEQVPYLISLIKQQRGILLSPSKGESFGLSAAEFLSAGVPVLLSNIPAHAELVEADERFLYPLGDISQAREKILWLCANWEEASLSLLQLGKKFESVNFINSWKSFTQTFK